jgi:hypothetical protein
MSVSSRVRVQYHTSLDYLLIASYAIDHVAELNFAVVTTKLSTSKVITVSAIAVL